MAEALAIHPCPYSFRIDNIVIDEYGEKIGAIGMAIYSVFSRYADRRTNEAFPNHKTIAKKLKIGVSTVKRYIKVLIAHGLVVVQPRFDKAGDRSSNLVILLDPTPDGKERRRRQINDLLRGTVGETLGQSRVNGGESTLTPPPSKNGSLRPDGQSTVVYDQGSGDQIILTTADGEKKAEPVVLTPRQAACLHHPDSVVHLPDDITICNNCYLLLKNGNHGGEELQQPVEKAA